MWNEISSELRRLVPEEAYNLWLEPIVEESYVVNNLGQFLTLGVPNGYFLQRVETEYKSQIQQVIDLKFGKGIKVLFQLISTDLIGEEELIETPKSKTQLMKKTKFNGSPYFKNEAEIISCYKNTGLQKTPTDITELEAMPNKYGIENVATFSLFDSKFFTYPNDKRLKAKVKVDLKFGDGTVKIFDLYRGQSRFDNSAGYGQLTTTHAKILLAIIHLWQYQGSPFVDGSGNFAVVRISIKELAGYLGYKKVSGSDYARLILRVNELVHSPFMLSDGISSFSLTFLIGFSTFVDKRIKRKIMDIGFNPFFSKQLFERKAFLRSSECYKIKNPTAFKFLLCYDKRIVKGNNLKIEICKAAKELEININHFANVLTVLKTAFKELNGYELNEQYLLKVELVKENKQWFVIAKRELKAGEAVKQLIQAVAQA
jgi:hypothetical protein